jgi:hypothetical protein
MTAADNPAAASAATRDCSSLIESSMEIFNYAHQRLAPNFPDVGVSLVVTPRNGRQLVFKSDYCMDSGSRHGPTGHDPHVQMDARSPDLHAAAYGLTGARADYGQSDTMAHGSRPRRTRNLDPFYREPQAQLAGNGESHISTSWYLAARRPLILIQSCLNVMGVCFSRVSYILVVDINHEVGISCAP